MLVVTRNNGVSLENRRTTVDALIHDARNPLNALSISLEILTERIRRAGDGAVDHGYARCLHSMRDSIYRLDEALQNIADSCQLSPLMEKSRSNGRPHSEG